MHLMLVTLALQLRTVALAVPPARHAGTDEAADSARDARRARSEQASFERVRRSQLPWEPGVEGRCEVRVGRFCWWYDDVSPELPPESAAIVERRAALITLLDSLASRHPGDDWIAGMTVHYRVDARDRAGAERAARACGGTRWWCDALLGYAAQAGDEPALADSAFGAALAAMPEEVRCEWPDIRAILPGDVRGRYEKLPCTDRAALEHRYWMLGRPRLAAPTNDWRTEFFARRVQGWLAKRSLTPQGLGWGDDAEELLLRYGWPVRWTRVQRSGASLTPDVSIIGHDPWPSFAFGPREILLDSLATGGDDGWELRARQSDARYGPPGVRRVAPVEAQLARFRRGDSTLVVAAFASSDDSIRAPVAQLAVALRDGRTQATAPDSTAHGVARLLVDHGPVLAGVELTDSLSGTLARTRLVLSAAGDSSAVALSDILLYRAGGEPVELLDSALARALPGARVTRSEPVGVYWEAYRRGSEGDSADVAVTVERIDSGFLRSIGQRLGLTDEDSPLRMRWTDARPVAAGTSSYAVSLDLSNLAPGRYRLSLTVTTGAGESATASRDLELMDR